MRRTRLPLTLAICVSLTWSFGCTLIQIHPYENLPQSNPSPTPTHANVEFGEKEASDGAFVGLAISGGGSRSAILATAVMLKLKQLGILERVDYMSSVSGGGLPAALYALDGKKDFRFDENTLDLMGRNFQQRWFGRWFLPHNIARYWFTDFTRSDIMVQVFDSNLFHDATFADLNENRPKLLINATHEGDDPAFMFSDEEFSSLHSDLSQYSIARAVNVSSALPGVFQSILLARYSIPPPQPTRLRYKHLYDGGPVDNLGLKTLRTILRNTLATSTDEKPFPEHCAVIAIDAAQRLNDDNSAHSAVRGPIDYFVDTNLFNAIDVMFDINRMDVLKDFGVDEEDIDRTIFSQFTIVDEERNLTRTCHFWHIALRHLEHLETVDSLDKSLWNRAMTIETSFGLKPSDRAALAEAARHLVDDSVKTADDERKNKAASDQLAPQFLFQMNAETPE